MKRRAGPVLQKTAPRLIGQGRLAALGAWLELLPGEMTEAFPGILLAYGEACVRAGKYRVGLDWLRRAAGAFGRAGDASGLTRALCVQGSAFSARGDQQEAEAVYRQALGEAQSEDAGLVDKVDVEAFNQSCALAFKLWETDAGEAVLHLKEARRLYRGDLLAEEAYADWPAPARERLRRQ